MSNIHPSVMLGVRMIAKNLATDELVALYMTASADFDPRLVQGYEKARDLFTIANGTRMHADTKHTLAIVVDERLKEQPS